MHDIIQVDAEGYTKFHNRAQYENIEISDSDVSKMMNDICCCLTQEPDLNLWPKDSAGGVQNEDHKINCAFKKYFKMLTNNSYNLSSKSQY